MKKYDLSVATGEYEVNGETKKRWENIGTLFEKDDGSRFLTLKRIVNLAGVPADGRDTVMVSVWEQREKGTAAPKQAAHSQAKGNAYKTEELLDDNLPF